MFNVLNINVVFVKQYTVNLLSSDNKLFLLLSSALTAVIVICATCVSLMIALLVYFVIRYYSNKSKHEDGERHFILADSQEKLATRIDSKKSLMSSRADSTKTLLSARTDSKRSLMSSNRTDSKSSLISNARLVTPQPGLGTPLIGEMGIYMYISLVFRYQNVKSASSRPFLLFAAVTIESS